MAGLKYTFNGVYEDEIQLSKNISSKGKKLTIILMRIIVFFVLVIIILIIFYLTMLEKDDEGYKIENKKRNKVIFKKEVKKQIKEEKYNIYPEIQTGENNKIKNSFGIRGENYIEEIGDVNNGKDYEANDRDNFDLCIPNSVLKKKTNYITILLDIHGGAWIAGNKNDVEELCKNDIYKNFIIATMSYTLLNGDYKEYNLFRIIDEITAVLKTLKIFLIEKGFNENKLELILQGTSAGAHLSLLYSYMIKNPPIPIKMIINNVAPVTLNPEYFLQTMPNAPPLDNIEPEDIINAINENKIILMNGSYTGVVANNAFIISSMNVWLGRLKDDSFDEIFSNIETGELNMNSKKYKELIYKTSYGNPISYVTKESIPTLCLYSCKDEYIGVVQYALLKKEFEGHNNQNISIVYFKYGTHDIFENATGEYGKKVEEAYKEEIYRYYRNYLDSYKKNN